MSILYGNIRLIYQDASWLLGKLLFLYIIVPLMVIWLLIGLIFNLPDGTVTGISVPVYIQIVIFAVAGFKSLFPIAVGMGSTRVQFLKSYYLTGLVAVVLVMLLLNVCQYVLATAYNQWIGWSNIFHPAVLFRNDYQFISYYWIDLMIGFFLFGFSFLIYCIWYRLGTVRGLILLIIMLITELFFYYGGVLNSWFIWIWRLNMDAFALLERSVWQLYSARIC